MAKTPKKAKEPVRLRFKALADGNKSIYLDIYRNGKRSYEFLKLYLVPETNPLQKQVNADTLKAANAIKAQRIIELANNEAGIKNTQRGKMLLIDWLEEYKQLKARKGKTAAIQKRVEYVKTLVDGYNGNKTRLVDVDKDYCSGFLVYVSNVYTTAQGKPLAKVTAYNYCSLFSSVLNEAVRQGIIGQNPFTLISADDKIKVPESQRTFLTIDEVKTLIKTPCKKDVVKQAYLFSVFCALRLSDVERLRWADVSNDGGQLRLSVVMKKNGKPIYVPLSKHAVEFLPERGTAAATDRVFDLPARTTINTVLKEWAAAAGIDKHTTFHTSRHTAATAMLTAGADIYTVSKILGHAKVSTTQIYAKIIDKKKDEAVSLVDNLFND